MATRRQLALGLLAPAAILLAACSGSGGSEKAFCTKVQAQQAALAGAVASPDQAAAVASLFDQLASVAPAPIQDSWKTLTSLVHQAAAASPGDTSARQATLQAAYQAAPAARTVSDYVRDTCGIDLTPTTTTTVPAAPTSTAKPKPAAKPPSTTRPAQKPPATTTAKPPATTAKPPATTAKPGSTTAAPPTTKG